MPSAVTMSSNLRQMVTSRTVFLHNAGDASRSIASAKRCLFEVDHEQTRRALDAEMRAHEERFKEKYNFDLRTDTPLDGRYEWVKVSGPSGAVEEVDGSRSTTSGEPAEKDAPAPAEIEPNVTSKATRQASIQMYFPRRKRHNGPKRLNSEPRKIRRSSETGAEH